MLKPKLKQQIKAKLKAVHTGAEKGDTKSLTLLALVEDTCNFTNLAGGDLSWRRRKKVKELCRGDKIARVILAV